MTHPSDIAGLSVDELVKQTIARQHAELEQKDRKIERLSARVKEADEACQRLCGVHGFATGHGDTVADMIDEIGVQIGALKERALRAEQQRDEAYERAAKEAERTGPTSHDPYECILAVAAAIRRLTAALAVDGPSNLRHFVLSHWDNQDMSHVDFRVHAYQIAAASDGEVG